MRTKEPEMRKPDFPNAVVSAYKGPLTEYEKTLFPWGRVVAIHEIGDYRIIEHLEPIVDGHRVTNRMSRRHGFHVDGTAHGYPTLDAAIIGAIAYKYDGCNSQAAAFFLKMIGAYNG